jgi:NitT/TauT family transport system substrate-binding protein
VEVYQIRVFLEVARRLSFTEAADSLNLTQPAISAKIKSLETEIGTPLFHRRGRGVQLTEVGQFLLQEGPRLIETETYLFQKIEEIKQGKFGQLHIGCTTSVSDDWLSEIVFQYRQTYLEVQTRCTVFQPAEQLYRSLIENQVDVGISDISFEEFAEISATAIADIHYSLIVSSNHPLGRQNWLSLRELRHHKWVLFPPGSPSRLLFESRLAELGLSVADLAQVETVDTPNLMRAYLIRGNYLGFASNLELQADLQAQVLKAISLQEFALPGSIFLLLPNHSRLSTIEDLPASNRRSKRSTPLQKFTALLQESAPALQIPGSFHSPAKMRSARLTRAGAPGLIHSPDVITLEIGTQNSTLPTITGGLVIQKLGLLEHFLPREGRYSSVRYDIRWQDFALGAPIITGLQSGQLQIGLLGDYPLLLSAIPPKTGDPIATTQLISFTATNPDGSCNAVIVPDASELQQVDDLRGCRIAVPWSSSAHGMLMRSLNAANLLSDVALTALDQSTLVRPYAHPKRKADGYAHFAPFHALACRQGKFRYLINDDLSGLPSFHGVVVSKILVDRYPEIAIAYLKALQAAQFWCARNPAALSLISRWTQLAPDIVDSILSSIYQPEQSAQFFSQMTIRPDWIEQHVTQLSAIPGNERLGAINLNHWIRSEFLHHVSPDQEAQSEI